MSRISVIALEQLPVMNVIEVIDTEAIMAARMAYLVSLWRSRDPPAGAVYDVDGTEFDPIKIIVETETVFELMERDRVNQAARAVTTALATGTDLDVIASRYPGGVPRLALVASPRSYPEFPQDWESDDRYRRRIILSANLLTPHGVFEAYVFWALTADPTLHDATATSVRGTGNVTVTLMAEGPNYIPTSAQLNNVLAYIEAESRKGLTDVVVTAPPTVTNARYSIRVWLYPGFEETQIMNDIAAGMAALIEKQRWLGFDHTRMAIDGVLSRPGVYNSVIDEPRKDVIVNEAGVVKVIGVELRYAGRGE